MTHRSLMIAAMSAIGLTALTTYSPEVISAQDKTGKPVSVFVAALKGECGPERMVMFHNGQVVVGPLIPTPYNMPNSGKTILTRFDKDPISRKSAEDEFRKNKLFRVVEAPAQADFVFCLCARYFRNRFPEEIRRKNNMPEIARVESQAGVVSVESYLKFPLDPKALNDSAFWKTDDQGVDPQDDQPANEKNKKRKENYEYAAQNLKNLAAVSGGRYYEVDTIGDTDQAFANIAEELRRYYWLGYYPPNTDHDGRYRKIGVTVSKSGTVIRARRGYRTPADDKAKSR
jgi:hypothetical protein